MTRPLRLWPVLVPVPGEEPVPVPDATAPAAAPAPEPVPPGNADEPSVTVAGAVAAPPSDAVEAGAAATAAEGATDASRDELLASVVELATAAPVGAPGAAEAPGEGGVVVPLRRRPRPMAEPAPLPLPIRPPLRLAPAEYDAVSPFRRRQAPPARRRRRTLVLLGRRFLAAALLVSLPLAVGAWLLGVPRLRLRDVTVEGTQRVDAAWIHATLAPWSGQNLLLVSLDSAQAAILRHPWIGAVELRKELPDRLQVRVRERVPVALLEQAGRVLYLDAEGRPIAAFDAARGPDGLTVVRVRAGVPPPFVGALAVVTEIAAVEPAWASGLTAVEVLGDEDFLVRTRALPFPILVRAGHVRARAGVLAELLPELVRRYPALEAVDLRFERRIVVQPITRVTGAGPATAPSSASAPPANEFAALSRRG